MPSPVEDDHPGETEGELRITHNPGLRMDILRRHGERQPACDCKKQFGDLSAHVQRMEERLVLLEGRFEESQERLLASVEHRIRGMLDLQTASPDQTQPRELATPHVRGRRREAKESDVDVVAAEDAQNLDSNADADGGDMSYKDKRRRKKARLAAILPFNTTFEFGDSLWDAALFIGSPYLSLWDSCLVLLLLIVAVAVQIVFLGITYFVFATSPTFDDVKMEHLEMWRINVGHNIKHYDELTMTSLAQRVCNPDLYVSEISSSTSSVVGAIDEYMGENYLFSGPMLVKVALLLWSLTVAREIMACWDLSRVVRALPKGETILAREDWSVRWCSISSARKLWVFTVCLFRIVAGLILWMLGNFFICTYTIATGDILLNAVALEIVLLVAERMFVLLPSRVKRLLRTLDEMQAHPRICSVGRMDIRPFFLTLALAATIIVLEFLVVEDVHSRANAARETLCGGAQDFIYSIDPFYLVYTTQSNPYNYTLEDMDKYAFRDAINESIYPEITPLFADDVEGATVLAPQPMALEFKVNGLGPVKARATWNAQQSSVGLMEHRGVVCQDSLHELAFARRFIVETGKNFGAINETVSVSAVKCHDLLHMCTTWPLVRALCPVSCGCGEPMGTLFMADPGYGCPLGCTNDPQSAFRLALAEVDCVERTAAELAEDTTWRAWGLQVGREIDAIFRSEPQMKPYENSTDMFWNMGCDVVPFWKEAATLTLGMNVDPCVGNWLEDWLSTKPLAAACPITCGCSNMTTADEGWFASFCSEKCAAR